MDVVCIIRLRLLRPVGVDLDTVHGRRTVDVDPDRRRPFLIRLQSRNGVGLRGSTVYRVMQGGREGEDVAVVLCPDRDVPGAGGKGGVNIKDGRVARRDSTDEPLRPPDRDQIGSGDLRSCLDVVVLLVDLIDGIVDIDAEPDLIVSERCFRLWSRCRTSRSLCLPG